MQFWKLKKRPINPKAVYVACMIGLTFGIPAVMLAPRLIEAREATKLQEGWPCIYAGTDTWSILEVNGREVTIRNYLTEEKVTVDRSKIETPDIIIPEEYRWVAWLFR